MSTENIREKISLFISFTNEINNLAFTNDHYTIPQSEKDKLTKFKIDGEPYDTTIRLKLRDYFPKIAVKYNQQLSSELKANEIDSNFLVIDAKNKTAILFENGLYEQFGNKDIDCLTYLKNIVAYFRLFNFLKDRDFCDYFNSANNQIIIYSSAKGIYKINYETIPTIPDDINIENSIIDFLKVADPIELRPYFKSSIFEFTEGTSEITLQNLITNCAQIISVAKRDHDLVIKSFDFTTFRNSLYKEKEKYFTNTREIINRIFGQVVGIPLSISAIVFATYKVSDDVFMLLCVLASFITYVIFYIRIQLEYRADIKELRTEFNTDFDIISNKSGLPNELITKEKTKIIRKIKSSISMVNFLIGITFILGMIVCIYIVYEIVRSEIICLLKSTLHLLY